MKYFKQFPLINYNGNLSRNIMLNAKIIKDVLNRYEVFYKYRVKSGETPDYIASQYYGNPDYAWLVWASNSILDPYFEWPLDYYDFHAMLEEKYGMAATRTKSIIDHYKYTGISGQSDIDVSRISWTISPETFDLYDVDEKSGWTPVYVYDYEQELNENKRDIRLIGSQYIGQIRNELSSIFKD